MKAFDHVKTILVILSSRALSFDISGLRNFIGHAYPGAAVFFESVSGDSVGAEAPHRVDLTIDMTEPNAHQSLFFAPKLRARSKNIVGRNVGWFYRRTRYDRLYDHKTDQAAPRDYLEQERWAQRKVLELAGVPVIRQGGVTQDRSKDIALDLPPLRQI